MLRVARLFVAFLSIAGLFLVLTPAAPANAAGCTEKVRRHKQQWPLYGYADTWQATVWTVCSTFARPTYISVYFTKTDSGPYGPRPSSTDINLNIRSLAYTCRVRNDHGILVTFAGKLTPSTMWAGRPIHTTVKWTYPGHPRTTCHYHYDTRVNKDEYYDFKVLALA